MNALKFFEHGVELAAETKLPQIRKNRRRRCNSGSSRGRDKFTAVCTENISEFIER
jgi:hypothetical protein